jgi:Leucine-rich repeat (LRR) protein
LRSLDLSQSDFKVLKQLYTLSLERLDIRGTKITSLSSVKHFSRLKELVIDANQFSAAELEKIPTTITVVKKATP